ncbi:MAG: N-acetylmuramoyl-L-alanine amidase [Deltaproteobacteria bacterium]|nr:N-acetylmuramoyl-L-alanine amidase [Deltaproteobacteria bacterium]MDZ4344183.1 N-acetylmuramoyl-L-alanine amidase [Candidatus Binatia bacterium]
MKCKRFLTLLALATLAASAAPRWVRGDGDGQRLQLAQMQRNEVAKEAIPPGASARSQEASTSQDGNPISGASDKARLTGVRFLSSQTYTRVMLDLTQEARFETRRLKEDATKGLPPRIYIDIFGARLAMDSKEAIPVQDGLLRQVRVGQFSSDVVRVVLDMTSLRSHNTFLLPDPFRLVIDIHGQETADRSAAVEKNNTPTPPVKGPKLAALGIRKIVLDPGHGGKDPGAIGVGGIAEKDIVLAVAQKLAKKLTKEMGIEVVLTRKNDSFVRLEDRTAIANAEDADLFLSLHMNASTSGDAKGLETYYLDNTSDEASLRLAARENGTSRKNVSDLQFILSDMTQNMKLEDSISLAHRLQGSLVGSMSKKLGGVKDLGVKKALFYVLVGARMPSVLVEMFFITNKIEGRAMSRESYQNAIVEALYDGIHKYGKSALAAKTL